MPRVKDSSINPDDLKLLLPGPESDRLDSFCQSPALSRKVVASRLAQRMLVAGLSKAVEEKVRAHGTRVRALLGAEPAEKKPAPGDFNVSEGKTEPGRLRLRRATIRLQPAAKEVLEKIAELTGLKTEAILGHLLLTASDQRLLEMIEAMSQAHLARIQEIRDEGSFAKIVAREAAKRSPIL